MTNIYCEFVWVEWCFLIIFLLLITVTYVSACVCMCGLYIYIYTFEKEERRMVRYYIYSDGNIWWPCGILEPLTDTEAIDLSFWQLTSDILLQRRNLFEKISWRSSWNGKRDRKHDDRKIKGNKREDWIVPCEMKREICFNSGEDGCGGGIKRGPGACCGLRRTHKWCLL